MQEMTCDKFVFGLIDDHIKERLLHEEQIDLPTAVGIRQWAESSKWQIKDMSSYSEINIMQRVRGKANQTETVDAITNLDSAQHMAKTVTKQTNFLEYVAAE